MTSKAIEKLAIECAEDAIAVCDPDMPELLPTDPQPADCEAFEDVLGREATLAEMKSFCDAYSGRIEEVL